MIYNNLQFLRKTDSEFIEAGLDYLSKRPKISDSKWGHPLKAVVRKKSMRR